MQWAYSEYGDELYIDLAKHEKAILDHAEAHDMDLSSKHKKALCSQSNWNKQLDILKTAQALHTAIGEKEYNDFNLFKAEIEAYLKEEKIKVSATQKNQIFNAVSWYDEGAEKVIKSKTKLSGNKLQELLNHLGCTEEQMSDYGYNPTANVDEYIIYDSDSDIRDTENVPLKESIHDYFLREVKPHVREAWINLKATKMGYEISFNKYFYQHKPLRDLEDVSKEILDLEKENEGLIMEILGA